MRAAAAAVRGCVPPRRARTRRTSAGGAVNRGHRLQVRDDAKHQPDLISVPVFHGLYAALVSWLKISTAKERSTKAERYKAHQELQPLSAPPR